MEKSQILIAIKIGYGLMTGEERRRASWLSLIIILSAIIDMLAILGIMPLVTLIVDPDSLNKYPSFQHYIGLIGNPSIDSIIVWLAAAASLLLSISLLLNIWVQYLLYRFGSHCSSRLAKEMMQECLQVPYSWHLKQNTSVLTRMFFGDIQLWGADFIQLILVVSQKLIVIIMAVTLVLYAAPMSGLLALLTVTVVMMVLLSFAKPNIIKLASEQRRKSDAIVMALTQCFSGIKDIKLSSRENYFLNLYSNAFWTFSRARMLLAVWKHIPPTLLVFVGQIGLILVAVILWKLGLSTSEIAANMALIILVSSRLIPAVNRVTGDLSGLWSSFPYIERLSALKETLQGDVTAKSQKSFENILAMVWQEAKLENLGYQYEQSNTNALDNISLKIEFGKSYGIAGPSGAGKSTIINILLGLLIPTKGNILIDGEILNASNVCSWQRNIGYVPQNPFIADDTLRSNVAFGFPPEEIDDDRVWSCLEMANIKEFCENLEEKLNTPLGDEGARLSGGQRQRIAIARALYDSPKLLVLDEATSALDTVSEKAIQKAIKQLHDKVTVIIIAHRLSTIKDCDLIIVLDQGCVVDSGTYDILNNECLLFQKLISSSHNTNAQETNIGHSVSA